VNDKRYALVRYRLSQAKESLEEADVLLHARMSHRSVVNRLYYAMFYSAMALLQDRQIGSSKHSDVISAYDKEFVKAGIFETALSKAFHRAFELRQ